VLTDPGSQFAAALGVVIHQPDDVVAAQAELGLHLTDHNAQGSPALPMPTTVVVNSDGVICWIDVQPNYTNRTEVAAILAALDLTV
jgi:hypothetical protein